MYRFYTTILMLAVVLLPLPAKPIITFEPETFDCGDVIEGKTRIVHAVFIVRNTGDQVLNINSVRPSCGCTVVKFGKTVEPGQTTNIESDVDITGYRAGPLFKTVSVNSDAENSPIKKLEIKMNIVAPVSLSKTFLSGRSSLEESLEIITKKNNLQITGIFFKANDQSNTAQWQSDLKIPVTFTLNKPTSDGNVAKYQLKIKYPATKTYISGTFIVQTNHPDKQIIKVNGEVNSL